MPLKFQNPSLISERAESLWQFIAIPKGDGVNHGIRHFVGHRKRQRVVGNFPRLRVPVEDQNPCSSALPHVLRVQLFIQPGHIPTNCDVAFTQNRNEGPGGSTLEKFQAPSFEFNGIPAF